jgi:superfamily II DNA or RNA helicase
MPANERIVLTVFPHAKWGAVVLPALVEKLSSGGLFILETAQETFSRISGLSEAAQEILRYTQKYSDQALMKAYSKEKEVRQFYASVTEHTIINYIRPFIESCHRKIIPLLADSGLSLYLRNEVIQRSFWPSDKIHVPDTKSSVVFSFEKDENGFRYSLQIEDESGQTDLFKQDCMVLCQEPAVIVSNKILRCFEDIDVKKIQPFFHKKAIEIPLSSEKNYMKTFVRNCVQKYHVHAIGLDIIGIEPQKTAFLSLEHDWNGRLILMASIYYEGKKYPLDHTFHKIVLTEETTDQVRLRWFYPDKQWEKRLRDSLVENGLRQLSPNTFSIHDSKDCNSEDGTYSLIEWLSTHKEAITAFQFSQNLDSLNYYLGEVSIESSVESRQDWFDLHCLVVFDHFKIPFNRFRHHILYRIREYVLPDGSIVILPIEWFTQYREVMFFSKDNRDGMVLKRNQYRVAATLNGGALFPDIQNTECPPLPATFRAELRSYQLVGFHWLVWLYHQGFGGCLADDMGLGKTIQAIALLAYIDNVQKSKSEEISIPSTPLRSESLQLSLFDSMEERKEAPTVLGATGKLPSKGLPSLVVMPTSLLYNWQLELRRFSPDLKVLVYSGSKRLKSKDIQAVFSHYSIILTTYGVIRNDIEWLKNCQFHHLILDESQYVKNPNSQTYLAVRDVQALYTVALTGTPIENSLTDLWAQFNLLNENMLGNYASFRNVYQNPISKDSKEMEVALLRIIQPFLLRRTKQEVAPDLPPLLEETVYCDMTLAQEACYTKEKNALRSSLLDEKAAENPKQLSLLTLQGLTRLRLLANHPVLALPTYAEDSGKFEQVAMRLETLQAEGHKVLVFSSFVRHLKLLAGFLDRNHQPYSWLTGSTPASDREKEINRFTNQPNISCFLISLKAGGVGLNLTAADYVFLLDPWWNPASEMQALSRSHRIGQNKNVIVYRFISSKTIEEKIRRLQESKSKLANTFVRSGNPLADLSREELDTLIQ